MRISGFWNKKVTKLFGEAPITLKEAAEHADTLDKRSFVMAFLYAHHKAKGVMNLENCLKEMSQAQTLFPPLKENGEPTAPPDVQNAEPNKG